VAPHWPPSHQILEPPLKLEELAQKAYRLDHHNVSHSNFLTLFKDGWDAVVTMILCLPDLSLSSSSSGGMAEKTATLTMHHASPGQSSAQWSDEWVPM